MLRRRTRGCKEQPEPFRNHQTIRKLSAILFGSAVEAPIHRMRARRNLNESLVR